MERALIIVVVASLIFATEGIQDPRLDFVQNLRNDIQRKNQSIVSNSHMRPTVAKLLVKNEETPDLEFARLPLPKSWFSGIFSFGKIVSTALKNLFKSGAGKTAIITETASIRPKALPGVQEFLKDIETMESSSSEALEKFQSFGKQIGSRVFLMEKNIQVDAIPFKTQGVNTKFSSSDFVLLEESAVIEEEIHNPIFLAIGEQTHADSVVIQKHFIELKPHAIKSHGVQDIIDGSLKTYNQQPKINKVYIVAAPATVATITTGVLYIGHLPEEFINKIQDNL